MYLKELRSLYKSILRLHRSLPKELREIGDIYVRDEFRRHKVSANEEQVKYFIKEWSEYYATLTKQVTVSPKKEPLISNDKIKEIGKPLPEKLLDEFQDQQLYQLYELKLAAQPSQEPNLTKKN